MLANRLSLLALASVASALVINIPKVIIIPHFTTLTVPSAVTLSLPATTITVSVPTALTIVNSISTSRTTVLTTSGTVKSTSTAPTSTVSSFTTNVTSVPSPSTSTLSSSSTTSVTPSSSSSVSVVPSSSVSSASSTSSSVSTISTTTTSVTPTVVVPPVATKIVTPPVGSPVVSVKNGTIFGTAVGAPFAQEAFLGIPYAHVTQRFAAASPLNGTYDVPVDATSYGVSCPGFGLDQALFPQAEDCLNLNIVRPAGTDVTAQLPVVVYMFGGAYRTGTASRNIYNMSYPVNQSQVLNTPIIGVTINYRVNAFGFLSSAEVQADGSLNQGSKDQRLALRWVNENIAAFGGDPSKVTIWGQSAGAFSVAAQLLAFGGRDDGLFRAAIMESGSPTAGNLYTPSAPIYQNPYNTLVNYFNCQGAASTLACLRAVPYNTFLPALDPANSIITVQWNPVIDGDFYQTAPSTQLANGQFVHVPVIGGTNLHEGTFFSAYNFNSDGAVRARLGGQFPTLSTDQIATLSSLYPDDASLYPTNDYNTGSTFNQSYPWNQFGTEYKRLAQILGDLVFIASRRLTAQVWAGAGLPYYSFNFGALANSYALSTPAPWGPQFGVTHNSELPYTFDNPTSNSTGNWGGQTQADVHLREFMSKSWIGFIATLDPNNNGGSFADAATWAPYSTATPQNHFLAVNLTTTPASFVSYYEDDIWRSSQITYINTELNAGLSH